MEKNHDNPQTQGPPQRRAQMIHRIVLTGGPCGGKTTALSRITERLASLGYRVFVVPEMATLFMAGGVALRGLDEGALFGTERAVLDAQIALEEAFQRAAELCGAPAVVIFDRGAMDFQAYLPARLWQAMLDEMHQSVVSLRDRRYDAVIHLVTAADGAEGFYSSETNRLRSEDAAQARLLDQALQRAWTGHAHFRVIDNSGDFEDKMRRVMQAIARIVGVPEPVEVERKFLLRSMPPALPVYSEEIEIEQVYLVSTNGAESRIRRRGQRGQFTYTHTEKRPQSLGQRIEVERPISAREYVTMLSQADPDSRPVRKYRTCFVWASQYFEIDRFEAPRADLVLLEAELDGDPQALLLPPFLDVEREVTGEVEYSNAQIAR